MSQQVGCLTLSAWSFSPIWHNSMCSFGDLPLEGWSKHCTLIYVHRWYIYTHCYTIYQMSCRHTCFARYSYGTSPYSITSWNVECNILTADSKPSFLYSNSHCSYIPTCNMYYSHTHKSTIINAFLFIYHLFSCIRLLTSHNLINNCYL